jgi:hypothetical protein
MRSKRRGGIADEALVLALKTIAALEIPHLAMDDDDDEVVH